MAQHFANSAWYYYTLLTFLVVGGIMAVRSKNRKDQYDLALNCLLTLQQSERALEQLRLREFNDEYVTPARRAYMKAQAHPPSMSRKELDEKVADVIRCYHEMNDLMWHVHRWVEYVDREQRRELASFKVEMDYLLPRHLRKCLHISIPKNLSDTLF